MTESPSGGAADRPRVTIGRLMLVIATPAVVLAIGVRAPSLLVILLVFIGWPGSGLIGHALGQRWPGLSLPIAILLNLAAVGMVLGPTLVRATGTKALLFPAFVTGGIVILIYPFALGWVMGRVGHPLTQGAGRLGDGWLTLLGLAPLVTVPLLLLVAAGDA